MPEESSRPKNIFDAASNIEKARIQKKTFSKKEDIESEYQEIAPLKEGREEKSTMADIFLKSKKLHEELSSQVDTLFSKNKVTPSEYRKYLIKPQNFSQKDWQQIEEQRKKNESLLGMLAKRIGTKVPFTVEPKKESEPQSEKPTSDTKPPAKKPKIITRRQWIGM